LKNNNIILVVIIFSYLLTGCNRAYIPGFYGSHPNGLIVKSDYKERTSSYYVSLDAAKASAFNNDETNYFLRAKITKVISSEHFNANIGLGLYGGRYTVKNFYDNTNMCYSVTPDFTGKNYDKNYTYFGFDPSISCGANLKYGGFKFGIGLQLSVFSEFGDFYKFRKEIKNNKAAFIDVKDAVINVAFSVFPYYAWEFEDGSSISLQTNVGLPGIVSPSFVYNTNKTSYWLSVWINSEKEDSLIPSIQFGVAMDISNFGF